MSLAILQFAIAHSVVLFMCVPCLTGLVAIIAQERALR